MVKTDFGMKFWGRGSIFGWRMEGLGRESKCYREARKITIECFVNGEDLLDDLRKILEPGRIIVYI